MTSDGKFGGDYRLIYFFGDDYRSFSFGIVCQYEFVRVLNKNGIPARFICSEGRDPAFPVPDVYLAFTMYETADKLTLAPDDVAVYPERIPDNPLHAKRVIRWLLNRPYSLTSEGIKYGSRDQIFAYSKFVNPDLPQMFYLPDERELFTEIRENGKHDRKTVTMYFGKTHLDVLKDRKDEIAGILSAYENRQVITRMDPANRRDALRMIADSEMLLSFDPFSNMNFEANILGVPVLIFEDAYGIKDLEFNIPLRGFAYSVSELEERKTQVDQVFHDYCTGIENQEKNIVENVRAAIRAFESMEKDPALEEENRERNKKIEEDDLLQYQRKWKKTRPFATILFPYELPFGIIKIVDSRIMGKKIRHILFLLKDFLRRSLNMVGLLEPVRRFRKRIKARFRRRGK